jgi:hypothetical protein
MKNTKSRIVFRACHRCHGDLIPDLLDKDTFNCLQCGCSVNAADVSVASVHPQPVAA